MQKPSNGTCPQDSRILGRLHGICSEINFHFTGVVPVSSIFDPEPAGGGEQFQAAKPHSSWLLLPQAAVLWPAVPYPPAVTAYH